MKNAITVICLMLLSALLAGCLSSRDPSFGPILPLRPHTRYNLLDCCDHPEVGDILLHTHESLSNGWLAASVQLEYTNRLMSCESIVRPVTNDEYSVMQFTTPFLVGNFRPDGSTLIVDFASPSQHKWSPPGRWFPARVWYKLRSISTERTESPNKPDARDGL